MIVKMIYFKSYILHRSTGKLFKHLLCIRRLTERDHVTSISHNKKVEVVSFRQVAHNLSVVVVDFTISNGICVRSGPFEVVYHVKNSRMVADDVKVFVIDKRFVVLKAELNVFSSIIHENLKHGMVNISFVREIKVSDMNSLS